MRALILIVTALGSLTIAGSWAKAEDGWNVIWTDPADSTQQIDIRYHEDHPNNPLLAQWNWDFRNRCRQKVEIHYEWKDKDGKKHDYWDSMPVGGTVGHSNTSGTQPEVEIVEVRFHGTPQSGQSGVGNTLVFPGPRKPSPNPK